MRRQDWLHSRGARESHCASGAGGGMAHPIITVATLKGGSGKSTVASCLGVHWHLRGMRTALLDTDPQRSIVRLAAREKALAGIPVVEDASDTAWETARKLAQTSRVIIDTPGFRSES